MKVLVIDDEQASAEFMASRLAKVGDFEMDIFTNPLEAASHIKSTNPDLVLLDFVMPTMSGLDCLKALRNIFPKDTLPIVMLTSEDSSASVIECFKAGANDFIVKGTPISVVSSRIQAHVSLAIISHKTVMAREMDAMLALIASYNHQINNPLTIAIGNLERLKITNDQNLYKKIEEALWRISGVMAQLAKLEEKFQVDYEKYSGNTKMIKIK